MSPNMVSVLSVRLRPEKLKSLVRLYEPPYPNAKMGSINPQEFKTEAELNGLKIPDYSGFFTNELIDAIDNYDVKKIQAQAIAYKR